MSTAKISPMAPHNDDRVALRNAIRERDSVKEQLRLAEQTEKHARELLHDAETKLASFGDVDGLILKHRADKFKRAAIGGPRPDDMSLPASLLASERARDEARSAVAAAKAAHECLAADLVQAENAVRKAEQNVGTAVGAIIGQEGAKQGAELRRLWNDLWDKVDALNALGSLWLPSVERPAPVKLPAEAVGLLQQCASYDHRQFPGGHNAVAGAYYAKWRTWYDALCSDADADVDTPVKQERVA